MIRFTTTLLFIIANLAIFAQEEEPSPEDYECVRNHQFPFSERMNHYPFNVSKKVMIVSFDSVRPDETVDDWYGDQGIVRIPLKNKQLDYELIKEHFILTGEQLDSLTDILYNYDYKNDKRIRSMPECFSPHHAIVFLDNGDKLITYLEICFICQNYETPDQKIKIGNFCSGKFDLLRGLFKQVGVTTKINKGER